jgi:type II secretory ATPase GspE/PulE/Tfp pilus assembly ATPase PilB-like protein
MPIYEILEVTPPIAEMIERGVSAAKLRELAIAEGMVELPLAGLEKVLAGITTLDEVFYKTAG